MKGNLLVLSNARNLLQCFGYLIPKLAEEYNVVILLTTQKNVTSPSSITEKISIWKKEGVIDTCIIAPDPTQTTFRVALDFHWFMKKTIKCLSAYKFDLWLSMGETQIDEKYILECVLPTHCIRVAIWPVLTYFLTFNQRLAERLLGSAEFRKYPQDITFRTPGSNFGEVDVETASSDRGFLEKIRNIKTFPSLSQKAYLFVLSRLKTLKEQSRGKVRHIIYRDVLPFLMVGKRFDSGPYDRITRMGSGRKMSAYIFFDEVEVEAHKRLFNTSNVYLAQYPSIEGCRCSAIGNKKTTILSPLSNLFGRMDELPEVFLQAFYRDFNTALCHSDANKIDIRLHPGETGKWPYHLCDYLNESGIDAQVVGNESMIGEIVCNYVGVIGNASSALRDCRASCKHAFVVGLVALSKHFVLSPEFAYGKSEGIGWINDDGSFSADIFKPFQYISTEKKSVIDIVMELKKCRR